MSKFIRTGTGVFSRFDKLDGLRRVDDGTMFNVQFPDGSTLNLPVIIRRRTYLQESFPNIIRFEEVAYFAVPAKGLSQVWMRAIDAPGVTMIPNPTNKPVKKPAKKPVKKPAKAPAKKK